MVFLNIDFFASSNFKTLQQKIESASIFKEDRNKF